MPDNADISVYRNGPTPSPMPEPYDNSKKYVTSFPYSLAPVLTAGAGASIGAYMDGTDGAIRGGMYGLAMPPFVGAGATLGSMLGGAVGMPGLGGLVGGAGAGWLTHKLIQKIGPKKKKPRNGLDLYAPFKEAGYSSDIPGPTQPRPLKYMKAKSNQAKILSAYGFPSENSIDPRVLTKEQVIASAKKLYGNKMNNLLIVDKLNRPNFATISKNRLGSKLSPEDRAKLARALFDYGLYIKSLQGHPHYMPTLNMVHSPGKNPALLAHEIGHAADFNEDKNWARRASRHLPIYGKLRTEYVANRNATEVMDNIKARDDTHKEQIESLRKNTLYPSYGSYVGAALGSLAGGAGAGLLALSADERSPLIAYPIIGGSLAGAVLGGFTGSNLGSLLAGKAKYKKPKKV